MKHELLAPAGNIEAGYAAIYYGADAVYLGLNKFSARAGALNFTFDELDEFSCFAHEKGKRVFVALNTILNEEEIKELPEVFAQLKRTKVDGLILQDLGVFYLAKKYLPEIELHASTQMAVHNVEGARFLQSLGFKRVVLARELRLEEIEKIARALPDLDLEVFVHGALCYSYSGECLFSALEYGKSANRGRCAYPCRGEFSENNVKSHLFSMKDLALEEAVMKIPALSLKIEGRKKSPLYVAAVTNYYRHILDGKKKDVIEAEDIKQIFSRPWCRFHFLKKDKDVVDRDFVGHRGLLIGKVQKVNKNRVVFRSNHKIARYDGLQIDDGREEKPFGFGIKNLWVDKKSVIEAKKGDIVEVELPSEHPHLRIEAPIYLASSSEVKGKYDYEKPKPKEYQNLVDIDVKVEIMPHEIWAISEGYSYCLKGEFLTANDEEKLNDNIRQAFSKLGGTGLKLGEIDISNPLKVFVPVSVLNNLRRGLVGQIDIKSEREEFIVPKMKVFEGKAHLFDDDKFIYVSLDMEREDFEVSGLENRWAVLPQVCRDVDRLKVIVDKLIAKGVHQFVVENYYGFELLKHKSGLKIASGSFIYVMNRFAVECLRKIGVSWVVPALENTAQNLEILAQSSPLFLVQVAKANPPLFTSAVCIRKHSCKECKGGEVRFLLKKDGKNYTAVSKPCQVCLYADKKYECKVVEGVYGVYESNSHFI